MKKLRRRLTGAFILAALFWAALVTASFFALSRFHSDSDWIAHTGIVLADLARLNDSFAQSDILGRFIAIGGEVAEDDLQRLRTETLANLETVKLHTQDNERQQENLLDIEKKIHMRFEFIDRMVAIRRSEGFDASMAYWRDNRGLQVLANAQHAISTAELEEARLLSERITGARRGATITILVVAALDCAIFSLTIATYFFMRRWVLAKMTIMDELQRANHLLAEQAENAVLPDGYAKLQKVIVRVESYLQGASAAG